MTRSVIARSVATKQSDLSKKRCKPCEGGVQRLSKERSVGFLKDLKEWRLSADENSIFAEWVMKDFMSAVGLIREIARVAERENHHPDIHLTGYRKLKIELSTHAIGGLSENDFILAAKITRLPKQLQSVRLHPAPPVV